MFFFQTPLLQYSIVAVPTSYIHEMDSRYCRQSTRHCSPVSSPRAVVYTVYRAAIYTHRIDRPQTGSLGLQLCVCMCTGPPVTRPVHSAHCTGPSPVTWHMFDRWRRLYGAVYANELTVSESRLVCTCEVGMCPVLYGSF